MMSLLQPLGVRSNNTADHRHTHKRGSEDELKGGAVTSYKKNRAAFGDITNRDSNSSAAPREASADGAVTAPPACNYQDDTAPPTHPTPSYLIRRVCVTDDTESPVATPPRPKYIDIDADGTTDTLICGQYASRIYEAMRTSETKKRPSTTYMEMVQNDVNPNMRSILVDWLVEVAQEYNMQPDTLYLTVAYVDRFLSSVAVARHELQLVGIACMLVAAKYEEIYAPTVQDFVYITDHSYTAEQLLSMEHKVLETLQYEVAGPTPYTFLRRFLRAAVAECVPDRRLDTLAHYLLELSLEDYSMLHFLPSQIAASAVLVALFLLSIHPTWSHTLSHYTGYLPRALKPCAVAMFTLLLRRQTTDELPAVKEKYDNARLAAPLLRHVSGEQLPEWLFQWQDA